jgi:hypothetical protein
MPIITRRVDWQEPKYPITGPVPLPAQITTVVYHYPGADWSDMDFDNDGDVDTTDTIVVTRQMQRSYLTSRGYSLGYGYVIGLGGDILEARGVDIRNAANNGVPAKNGGIKNFNNVSTSILFIVDDVDRTTGAQLDSAVWLHHQIEGRYGRILQVKGHGEIDATPCPGIGIYSQLPELRERVRSAPVPVPPDKPNIPSKPAPPIGEDKMDILTRYSDGSVYVVASDLSWRFKVSETTHDQLKASGRYLVVALTAQEIEQIPGKDY